jgi:tRNA-dihydrouridine synthase
MTDIAAARVIARDMLRATNYARQIDYCLRKAQSAPTEEAAQVWKTIAESYQRLLEYEKFYPPLNGGQPRHMDGSQS